ncbi:MAG: LacI family transcriptional regulator [Spirochaetaceae bacterium]
MGKRITVYDIASELNISPSTVSRVLNNSNLISSERSKQIKETATRLGYKKRSIKKQISRAILNIYIFLPETDNNLTHFFYNISELMDAVQTGFGDVKLNCITRVNDGNIDFLDNKKTGQIDGCIFAFTQPSDLLAKKCEERFIPFISLNRLTEKGSYIIYDIAQGITLLAEKMVKSKGKKLRPCFIGFTKLPRISKDRFNAAKNIFDKYNIHFDEDCYLEIDDFKYINSTGLDWIQEGNFNGIMAFNDLAALSVLQSGMGRGLNFPSDLMLSGFDDSQIQQLLDRRIDTIALSIPKLGQMAGSWLKSWVIDRKEVQLQEKLSVEYIPGDTIHIKD